MRNPFTQLAKFFAPVVGVISRMFGKKSTEKPVVVSHKEAMRRKDALAQVTFWKRVMKRRNKKGRATRKPTQKYLRALENL